MRTTLAACLLTLLVAVPAQAAVRTYALVIGVNTSVDPGVASLKFADDDAAKYARLFDRIADSTTLLTVFDADSRFVYKDLAERALVPDRATLSKALTDLRVAAVKEHAAGNQIVVYFAYVGHGARDKSGEGYVNLTDQKFLRSDLRKLVIEQPANPAARFDTLHVIVDACSAYFVVHDRGGTGPGLTPATEDYSARMGELFGAGTAPEKTPTVGFLLATTGDVKVHEWSAWRGGVFSHLVRSGLSGAADVDLDGKVTYPELGAFIAAASGNIRDPRARVDVTVSPPPAKSDAALSDRNKFQPRQLVFLEPGIGGHFEIETEEGERVIDLNKPRGLASVFAVWGAGKYYLTGTEGETKLDFSKKTLVASNTMTFGERRRADRGAIDEEYRRALFSRPFDYSFYRAYCSLLRLPTADAPTQPMLPEELNEKEAKEVKVAVAEPPVQPEIKAVQPALKPVEPEPVPLAPVRPSQRPATESAGNTVRTGAWVALGAGVVLGAGAALGFGLGASAKQATTESMVYNGVGWGASVTGGVALVTALSLIALDLTKPEAPVRVGVSGNGVAVAGRF
ncbi:MAG: caspase family protein [Myxococcales bacterium]